MTLFIGQSTYKSLNGRLDIYLMLWLANLNLPTASSFPDDVFCAPHSQHFSQPCFNSERLWAVDQVIRIYLLRILKLTRKVQSMTSSTGPGGTAKPPGPQEDTQRRTENQLKAVFFSAVCCAVKSSDTSVPSAVDDATKASTASGIVSAFKSFPLNAVLFAAERGLQISPKMLALLRVYTLQLKHRTLNLKAKQSKQMMEFSHLWGVHWKTGDECYRQKNTV